MEQVRRIGVDWKKPEDPPPTPNSRFYRKVFLLHLFLPRNIRGKEVEATRKYRKKLEPFWAQTPTCISPTKTLEKVDKKKSPFEIPLTISTRFPLSPKKILNARREPAFFEPNQQRHFSRIQKKKKRKEKKAKATTSVFPDMEVRM